MLVRRLRKKLRQLSKTNNSLALVESVPVSNKMLGTVCTDTTTLTVTLSDINDNDPTFNTSHYVIHVTENAGPQTVLTLSASDDDDGLNGQIR